MKSLFEKQHEPFVYHQYYLKVQQIWASKMSSLAERLSRKKLICLLVLFILLSSGYLIFNIYKTSKEDIMVSKDGSKSSKIKLIN